MKRPYRKKENKLYRGLAGLCLLALLFVSGCQSRNSGQVGRVSESRETGPAAGKDLLQEFQDQIVEPLVKVGFVQTGHESDWRVEVTRRCRRLFSKKRGYQLYFVDADGQAALQARAVREFIRASVDYIIIDPILSTGWTAVLKEAYHAKIPVFVIDRTIECDPRYYRMWIGSDFQREGRIAAIWLHAYLSGRGRSGEKIKIATVKGTPGSAAQLGRSSGFEQYARRQKNWELLGSRNGDFTEAGGRRAVKKLLEAYPDLNVLVCQNDNEAIGACQVLDEAGLDYGRNGKILVLSFDATRQGLEAVYEGRINFDLECDPGAVDYAARAIEKLEAGQVLLDRHQVLSGQAYTSDAYLPLLHIDGAPVSLCQVTKDVLDQREY